MLSGKVASFYTFRASKFIAGWSLLELLCVLALTAVAGHIWVPTWQQAMDKLSLQQYQHGMLQQLRQSRAWAQQHEQAVTLIGWANDVQSIHLIAFIDANGDRRWQAQEALIARQHYPIAISFSRGDYVRFSKLGTTGQSGSWHLCHANLDQGWKLILSSSGNLRVEEFDCRG
jgi:Tfp pilus assembly protein FimT